MLNSYTQNLWLMKQISWFTLAENYSVALSLYEGSSMFRVQAAGTIEAMG